MHVAPTNPWLETFRLLSHAARQPAAGWQALARHVVDSLVRLPDCPVAALWIWQPQSVTVALRVVAPSWTAALPVVDQIAEAFSQLPDPHPAVPEPLVRYLQVSIGPPRPETILVTVPLQQGDTLIGALVIGQSHPAESSPMLVTAQDMI
ncbi:MAG: hypothetical protein H7338_11800, partial [Candidatus Sericytochromatia bacterium]|nr:hypothetical protein [Candidatus Sericytochromatia bacterium]